MIYNIYCKVEFLQFYAVKIDFLCLKMTKISQVGDGAQPPPQTPPHAERKNQYCGRTTFQQLAPPLTPGLCLIGDGDWVWFCVNLQMIYN